MKLRSVEIENFRAIKQLKLSLDDSLTVFHGDNAHGKTSVLAAIAAALGAIPTLLPEVTGTKFRDADRRRSARSVRVVLETTDGIEWAMRRGGTRRPNSVRSLRDEIKNIIEADEEGRDVDLPIVAFYDTDRAVFDAPQRRTHFPKEFPRYAALEGALSVRPNFRDFFQVVLRQGRRRTTRAETSEQFRIEGAAGGSHGNHVDDPWCIRAAHRTPTTSFCGVVGFGVRASGRPHARPTQWRLSHHPGTGG